MKKLAVFLILLCSSITMAADSKVSALTEMTTPDVNDCLYIVDDPCGSPSPQRITWSNLFNGYAGGTDIITLGTIATGIWNGTAIDISSYTNLAVGTYIILTDDTLEVPVAVVTDGDDANLPTCDNVYDFVIGLNYLSSVDISDNTNLTAGTHVSLTDDTFDVLIGNVANGDDVNVPTCDNVYDYIAGLGHLVSADIDTLAELNTIVADVNLVYHSSSFVIQDVNAALHDFVFWKTPKAITLKKFSAICSGGTNVAGQLQEYDSNAANPVDVNTADFTITTSQYTTSSFTNPTIDANDWLGWKTTSESGTVNFLTISFEYTDD